MKNNILRKLEKKPTLDFNNMSLFHFNILKKKKNSNFRGISKQKYSSFIIKMLDETPTNFNKTVKKISATAYNNLLKKNNSPYKPLNTNYSLTKRSETSSFEKRLNKIESQVIRKNEYLKEFKNKSIMEPKKISFHKYKSNINLNNSYFSPQSNKDRKIPNSFNEIRRKRLDNLYGYDSNFIKSKKHLLRKKDSFELDTYQNEVLKVSQRNLSSDYMMKLYTELQFIKKDAELVKPLPPINYHSLVTHCFKEEKTEKKKQNEKSKEKKVYKKLDEYEKELLKIRKSNKFKREKTKRSKRMYKIYEILPEYVINVLYKKKNKPINI